VHPAVTQLEVKTSLTPSAKRTEQSWFTFGLVDSVTVPVQTAVVSQAAWLASNGAAAGVPSLNLHQKVDPVVCDEN
jgi:hypothetical protein